MELKIEELLEGTKVKDIEKITGEGIPLSILYHIKVPDGTSPRDIQVITSRMKKVLPPGVKFFTTTESFNLHALSRNEIMQFKRSIDQIANEILKAEGMKL